MNFKDLSLAQTFLVLGLLGATLLAKKFIPELSSDLVTVVSVLLAGFLKSPVQPSLPETPKGDA